MPNSHVPCQKVEALLLLEGWLVVALLSFHRSSRRPASCNSCPPPFLISAPLAIATLPPPTLAAHTHEPRGARLLFARVQTPSFPCAIAGAHRCEKRTLKYMLLLGVYLPWWGHPLGHRNHAQRLHSEVATRNAPCFFLPYQCVYSPCTFFNPSDPFFPLRALSKSLENDHPLPLSPLTPTLMVFCAYPHFSFVFQRRWYTE